MSILVLGSNGQLARHLREVLEEDASFCGRREIDLKDAAAAEAAILRASPTAIINAAAYTAVDKAEDEPELAWRINAEGAAAVARAAAALDIPLLHVSTDYVFGGDSERPYRDSDPTFPVNIYGKTKLAGELAVASLCRQHWILRAGWIFSELDGNFVTTMLRLAGERDQLRIVADQHGRPTYAGHLARMIALLVTGRTRSSVPWGTFHVGGGDPTSWYKFATQIISCACKQELLKQRPSIEAILTVDYPTRARRPMYSILAPSDALEKAFGGALDWQTGLDEVLARLRSGN